MSNQFVMPIPFGWFCIGYSDELAVGDVRNIHYFGRDMVLFRTESGKVGLTDPACPHLGAHLGHGGTVQGESIRCPFHHWQYDTQGVITDIPYAKRIPPKVAGKPCLKTYPTCEKNAVIWAWYHPEDAAPDHEVIALEEIDNPEWVEQIRFQWTFDSCPQEIAENGVDKTVEVRFAYTHENYPQDSFKHQAVEAAIALTNGQSGLEGDIPIWHHKFHLRNPILCDGDGPVMRFRKYFSQFYVDGPYPGTDNISTTLEAVS